MYYPDRKSQLKIQSGTVKGKKGKNLNSADGMAKLIASEGNSCQIDPMIGLFAHEGQLTHRNTSVPWKQSQRRGLSR